MYNAGVPRLIIISLVMQYGPGNFLSFNLAKVLFSSSYEIGESITGESITGESITGELSSGSSMILSCYRVSLCCYLYIARLLVSISK